jgi:asparagine synthase (glutamine-hydrolysing)
MYRDVFKLMPGHWLRASIDQVDTRQYWDVVEFDTDRRPASELLDEIDSTLSAAVLDRLESEVPLGAFLSGGIDSGLVVSYMAKPLGERLVTVSVGFGAAGHNELEAAGITARHFGARHHEEVIEPRLHDVIDRVTDGLGEPLADSSAIPTWYVSKAARQHVTVALSGDGGDETFAGYDFRYVPHAIEAAARRFVPSRLSKIPGWLGARWPRGQALPKVLRAGTLLENLSRDPADAYFSDLTFLRPSEAQVLMGRAPDGDLSNSPVHATITDAYRRCTSRDPVQRAEYADLKVYLPNDPLVKVDRMSMAHGLEVRCPLLDRRVVELAFRIPASVKQEGFRGKTLLRALARRRLPGRLWSLPKRGFTAPIGEWIRGPYAGMYRDDVLNGSAMVGDHIDVGDLKSRYHAHVGGTADHGYTLWAVWVFERWLRSASTAALRHD